MTEDMIERQAERTMNGLDNRLMNGHLSQKEYDAEVRVLDRKTADLLRKLRA